MNALEWFAILWLLVVVYDVYIDNKPAFYTSVIIVNIYVAASYTHDLIIEALKPTL